MFVRLFVDENLDRHVPISKQPKEKIQAIIDSCTRQFPEYSERSRKRIRTYLKSCRRTKRSREQAGLDINNVSIEPVNVLARLATINNNIIIVEAKDTQETDRKIPQIVVNILKVTSSLSLLTYLIHQKLFIISQLNYRHCCHNLILQEFSHNNSWLY